MPFQTNMFPHIENKIAARMLWNRGGKGNRREKRGEGRGGKREEKRAEER